MIDSRSRKATENTSLSGYDAGIRIKGCKRHIITDTCGNLIAGEAHGTNIQDRDGAPGGYGGPTLRVGGLPRALSSPQAANAGQGVGRVRMARSLPSFGQEIHRESRGQVADRPYPARDPTPCNGLKFFIPF